MSTNRQPRTAAFSRLIEQSAQLQRQRAQHLCSTLAAMGGDMERVRTMTPRERVREAFYTAAIAALIIVLMLGSTVGSIDAYDGSIDAYDEPAPAIVEAIRDARVAAREAQLPEPWPPR